MKQIHVLDSETIDKIAAGEVVERPASVVKELVENAIDAGATAITVEAKDGGISFLRVTDNGFGMAKEQLRIAFVRHATSKIDNAEDLNHIASLGFRGEALSSIAAVAKVEAVTKEAEELTGTRMCIEGGVEKELEEIGAPDGTTFLVRNIFFNTPVRKKFLKQPATEGGYITELMEHMALSRPDISFKFVLGSQTRFHTSGNGDLKEVIYRIYGREIANALVPIQCKRHGISVEGYLGKPILVRSNRNYELYYINGRFIKSTVIAKAIEEGYKEYLMQHKFPMCVLHITMDPESVDVNVHPTKMDVRFSNNFLVSETIRDMVHDVLCGKEMIPAGSFENDKDRIRRENEERKLSYKEHTPEPFELDRGKNYRLEEEAKYEAVIHKKEKQDFKENPVWKRVLGEKKLEENATMASNFGESKRPSMSDDTMTETNFIFDSTEEEDEDTFFVEDITEKKTTTNVLVEEDHIIQTGNGDVDESLKISSENHKNTSDVQVSTEVGETTELAKGVKTLEAVKEDTSDTITDVSQMNLFEEKILTQNNRDRYRIIGQVFDTYWMIEFEKQLLIIDQHAAHEKVKYERLMKQYKEKQVVSQTLFPPIVVSLSGQEEVVLQEYMDTFVALGFEVEHFGGAEYALRSVPVDLYGSNERELFLSVLDELSEDAVKRNPRLIEEKIASMSCKAAVKGNNRLSFEEANELIDELLSLDNPYNCPHGRPTIITISQYEMEKKFKRIV